MGEIWVPPLHFPRIFRCLQTLPPLRLAMRLEVDVALSMDFSMTHDGSMGMVYLQILKTNIERGWPSKIEVMAGL